MDITVAEVWPRQLAREVCYNCTFMNDLNSTCVVVVHPCGMNSQYSGLFNISVRKLERDGNSAVGCVDVSLCEDKYHAEVFYFNVRKGMIEGPPLDIMKSVDGNQEVGSAYCPFF